MADGELLELSVLRAIEAPVAPVWRTMIGRSEGRYRPTLCGAEARDVDVLAFMPGPDGEDGARDGVVLAFGPERRFGFTARYTATARHWTEEAIEQHREMGFETGWAGAADRLGTVREAR